MKTINIVDFARWDGMPDTLAEKLKAIGQAFNASAVKTELVSYVAQF